MKKFVAALSLSVLLLVPGAVLAQQSHPDGEQEIVVKKKDVPPEILKRIETEKQVESVKERVATYGKWVGLGKELGTAVNESLSALTAQADNFSKTGVGKFTMFIVAYKVLGRDFIGVAIGVPLLILGTCIFLWSYRKTCLPYKILSKVNADKSREYTVINNEKLDNQASRDHFVGMRWSHIVVYLIFLLATCIFVIWQFVPIFGWGFSFVSVAILF